MSQSTVNIKRIAISTGGGDAPGLKCSHPGSRAFSDQPGLGGLWDT